MTLNGQGFIFSLWATTNAPDNTEYIFLKHNTMDKSIFQDTYYSVAASASPFVYSITDGTDTVVFNGKAWVAPFEETIKIAINKIAQDYLSMDFPNLALADAVPNSYATVTHEGAWKTFYLRNSGGTPLAGYSFLLDWSYKEKTFSSDLQLSEPINGHGASGMYYFNTWWEHDSTPQAVKTDLSVNASQVFDVEGYEVYDENYCGDVALYYLNRNGGWDSFLCEGRTKKSDDYTRYNITRPYDNSTLEWGKKNYNNQITTNWEVNSGWLSDPQSERLAFHLLSSNQVYLHDLKTGEISPAVLTDASTDYKTLRNNGTRMSNYTINLSLSQTTQNIS